MDVTGPITFIGGTGGGGGAGTVTSITLTSTGNTVTITGTNPVTTTGTINLEVANASPAGANPTAVIGLTAVNGSAATFMRSDGAPPLNQAITPSWSGAHSFSAQITNTVNARGPASGFFASTSGSPSYGWQDTSQATDAKNWDFSIIAGVLTLRAVNDANSAAVNIFAVNRSGGNITALTYGTNTNSPTHSFLGGAASFGGAVSAPSFTVNGTTVPVAGFYRPATNVVGVATATTLCSEWDANGNYITLKGRGDQSYSRQVPSTGFTITIANNTRTLLLIPAGTLATGTITMPATPFDGQEVRFSTSQTITSLTVSPNTSQSILNAPTTATPGQGFAWLYNLANTQWIRLY